MTSTARSGPLLCSGSPRSYKGLGVAGRKVFSASQQMRLTIRRKLGREAADILAVPQISESGDNIDWYAPFDGPVTPWSAATPEERDEAARQLQRARESYLRQGEEELANGGSGDRELFAKMLPLSLRIPDDRHIYLVGNRPVVTFWSFEPLTASANYDVIRDLQGQPQAAYTSPPPPEPTSTVEPPARPWWRRLLWLLLPLLLLALLLFGLRACNINVPLPGISLPDTGGNLTLPAAPNFPGAAVPGVTIPGVAIGVPGTGGLGGDAATGVGGSGPGTAPAPGDSGRPAGAKSPPLEPPPAETPLGRDQQPNSPSADGGTPPNPVPSGQSAPAQPPLIIPPEALANGSTDFLNGRWTSRTGLIDSETGRPIEMLYEFQNGQGTATLKRSDGVQCTAPVQAAMQAGTLMIDQTQDAACADGQVFQRSTVECLAGEGGRANCTGANADGAGYNVQIVQ